jgi:hypothetical protein
MVHRRLALYLLLNAILFAQQSAPIIQIAGAVKQPLSLGAADLAKLPRETVKVAGSEKDTVYEGVLVHEILKLAGVPEAEALRGGALASYVIAEAQDGYQVVFSLAELDPSFIDNEILLADTADGKPLS